MFSLKMEDIFTPENLKNNSKSFFNFKKVSDELITGKYIPKPLKRIEIPKPNGEKRPIGIADDIDKTIQKTLYVFLNEYFNKTFSNHSYAYRPNKGTLRAIKRVKDYYKRKFFYIYKADIDDFFENINHNILIDILDREIEDKRIIRLIAQYIKNGILFRGYKRHFEGVHQGDVLSPLLSNIYLNKFDRFCEKEKVEFVRFADDLIFLFRDKNEIDKKITKIKSFLEKLSLKFDEKKSYKSSFSKGFEYLGCFFKNENISIEKERFERILSSVDELKSLEIKKFFEKIEEKYEGVFRYYLKIINDNNQKNRLIEYFRLVIIEKFKEEFKKKTKKEIKKFISNIEMKNFDLDKLSDIAYEIYKSEKELVPKKKIEKQEKKIVKNFVKSSVIVISEYGYFLGVAKNKITLKQKGKIKKTFPFGLVKRIVINAKGVAFSSNFIHKCVKKGISIEFIDYAYNPYAMVYAYNLGYPKTAINQLKVLNSKRRVEFAKEFVRAKVTNQKNYIRYLNKYYKNFDKDIEKLKNIIDKIKHSKHIDELMGYEGSSANIYWNCIGKVLRENNFKRVTKGAKDRINSAFNYGYALLYNRVQQALIKAGLSINISFLHALDNKPTLVFDFIEEFRSFVVDRAVVFALNKSDDINVDNTGKLSKNARKRIIEEVNERLGSFQKYGSVKRSIEDIILLQAYKLSKAINENSSYKSFIARF